MKHTLMTNEFKNDPTLRVERGRDLFFFDLGTFCIGTRDYLRTVAIGISHFHMDHIRCMDALIGLAMDTQASMTVVGPLGAADKLSCRIRSFELNLIKNQWPAFHVVEVSPDGSLSYDVLFPSGDVVRSEAADLPVGLTAAVLDHGVASIAYALEDEDSVSVDAAKLDALGLRPGPWIQEAKASYQSGHWKMDVDGNSVDLSAFMSLKKGEKVVYATDFSFSEENLAALKQIGMDADVLYCEAMYRNEDEELAGANYHLTAAQAEKVALTLKASDTVFFHQSPRYMSAG
jgi:ribonuclease Z